MAKNRRLSLNFKGFRELRTLPVVDDFILDAAKKVAARAGEGYEAHASPGRNRARAVVTPETLEKAMETATEPQILISALGGIPTRESDDDLVEYTTKAGKKRTATRAQVRNWTRGST